MGGDDLNKKVTGTEEQVTHEASAAENEARSALLEAEGTTDTAKSRGSGETGGLSDKAVDALDQVGNKFGELIHKAKGAFNDARKKD